MQWRVEGPSQMDGGFIISVELPMPARAVFKVYRDSDEAWCITEVPGWVPSGPPQLYRIMPNMRHAEIDAAIADMVPHIMARWGEATDE